MTGVDVVYTVMDFLKANVCPNVKYLKPAKEDARDYEEIYVNPQVFAFFEPTKGRFPEGVEYDTPGIVVQLQQGQDNISENKSEYGIILSFCIWRPGEYTKQSDTALCDIAQNEDGLSFEYSADVKNSFVRNEDGWKDVYYFMEETKRQIIMAGHIGNLNLKPKEPIRHGPYAKDGAFLDFYPYYYLWMSFTLETIVSPVIREYDDLL